MLGKMLVHGLVAAAIIGGTAAIYSQIPDNTTPSPQVSQADAAGQSNVGQARHQLGHQHPLVGGSAGVRPLAVRCRPGRCLGPERSGQPARSTRPRTSVVADHVKLG